MQIKSKNICDHLRVSVDYFFLFGFGLSGLEIMQFTFMNLEQGVVCCRLLHGQALYQDIIMIDNAIGNN